MANGARIDLFASGPNLRFEKLHPYLTDDLLRLDAMSCRLRRDDLGKLCRDLGQAAKHGAPRPLSGMPFGLPRGNFRFIAVDVETANSDCATICQIGIACVGHDGALTTWSTLVDPGAPFDAFNTRLHGIGPEQVAGAPDFAEIAAALGPLMARHPLIQHSSFDKRAFRHAYQRMGASDPGWVWHDSVQIARRAWPEFRQNGGHGLAHLKERLGLIFDHHDAEEDARAAALVVLQAERRLDADYLRILGYLEGR